jgi:two-component system nitrate/nitrite response regulator NarL
MTMQRIESTPEGPCQCDLNGSGSAPRVTIALVGENSLMRTGLQHILSGSPFVLAEEAVTADPVQARCWDEPPALFLVNASQDDRHVATIARQVKEAYPQARVVALADHFDARFVGLGLAAGLDGFCLTVSGREVLIKSLELIMLGETIVPSTTVRSFLAQAVQSTPQLQDSMGSKFDPSDLRDFRLSAREAEVLNCLRDGSPNKIIARKLDVTEATIKVHVKALLRKIGAANRTQAAMWAAEHLSKKTEAFLSA